MIALARVDDRLVHGQVLCAWVPHTGADTLLIVSDEVAADEMRREIFSGCAREGLSVEVRRVDEAAPFVEGPEMRERRIIVVFGSLDDAWRAYRSGLRFSTLNVGNIHREGGRRVSDSVSLNDDDLAILDRFNSSGVTVEFRDVPDAGIVRY